VVRVVVFDFSFDGSDVRGESSPEIEGVVHRGAEGKSIGLEKYREIGRTLQ
jgi:hypothetical protein